VSRRTSFDKSERIFLFLDLWFCFWYTQQLNNGHTELGCQSLLEKTLLYRHPQKITRRRNPLELSIHQKKRKKKLEEAENKEKTNL
jgi:hypothetical protein